MTTKGRQSLADQRASVRASHWRQPYATVTNFARVHDAKRPALCVRSKGTSLNARSGTGKWVVPIDRWQGRPLNSNLTSSHFEALHFFHLLIKMHESQYVFEIINARLKENPY